MIEDEVPQLQEYEIVEETKCPICLKNKLNDSIDESLCNACVLSSVGWANA